MVREAQVRSPMETGGMLLGYVSPGRGTDQIVIDEIVGPGPRAIHERRRFEPDGAWQEARLADRYEASGRITTYLGDWHTHPDGAPTPSRRDRRTVRAIARSRAARAPRPLMFIMAFDLDHTAGAGWYGAMYRWGSGRLERVPCELL